MMEARLQRRVQRYGWDKAAPWYEQSWHRQLAPAQTRLLALASLRPGERVLDVACGTGLVTFAAAAAVGPEGTVVGTDISDAMIAHANTRAAGLRHDLRFERMDAEELTLPNATFDMALCALGLMYVPDVATEHHSVLATCDVLEREGYEIARLPVGADGLVDLDALRDALRTPTRLVSIMLANGEIGVLQPIAEIASIVHAAGALLHTDASQAAGKIPVDVRTLGVDLMSLTAHKMYGPKGIGALYIRSNVGPIEPILHGGGQEGGRRSGTLNVPAIVGFGVAAEIAMTEVEDEGARVGTLRDRLLAGLLHAIHDLRINGSMAARLPHNLHVSGLASIPRC